MHNRPDVLAHLRKHQTYPAQKSDLTKTCNHMEDLEPNDRQWLEETLQEKKYRSANEVIELLGW